MTLSQSEKTSIEQLTQSKSAIEKLQHEREELLKNKV